MKPTAELHDWSIQCWEDGSHYLIGILYNHRGRPDLRDGYPVRTSTLIKIDFEKGEAETMNTIYTLK